MYSFFLPTLFLVTVVYLYINCFAAYRNPAFKIAERFNQAKRKRVVVTLILKNDFEPIICN
jgi:hypothetical protein